MGAIACNFSAHRGLSKTRRLVNILFARFVEAVFVELAQINDFAIFIQELAIFLFWRRLLASVIEVREGFCGVDSVKFVAIRRKSLWVRGFDDGLVAVGRRCHSELCKAECSHCLVWSRIIRPFVLWRVKLLREQILQEVVNAII